MSWRRGNDGWRFIFCLLFVLFFSPENKTWVERFEPIREKENKENMKASEQGKAKTARLVPGNVNYGWIVCLLFSSSMFFSDQSPSTTVYTQPVCALHRQRALNTSGVLARPARVSTNRCDERCPDPETGAFTPHDHSRPLTTMCGPPRRLVPSVKEKKKVAIEEKR